MALSLAAGVSLCVAMGFWWVGVPGVLPFACVEMLCLGLALVLYAGRATDRDVVELNGSELQVRCLRRGREQVTSWPSMWVRVSCEPHPQGQIELAAAGQRVLIGGEVPWAQRQRVAQSIRNALHG